MRRKRLLGIPIPIAVAMTVLLVGGIALAAFLMTREVPSTVRIVGVDEAEVYADEGLTVPLTDLDFGEIMPGETTDPITFWVKNNSDPSGNPFYIALSQSGLDPLLGLFEDANGVVPEDPNELPLVTGSDYAKGYWEAGSPTTSISGGIDASVTTLEVADIAGFDASGDLYCEGEVIAYTGLRAYEAEVPDGTEIPGYWTPVDPEVSSPLRAELLEAEPYISVSGTALPSSGTVKIDDEIISYDGVTLCPPSGQDLLNLIRGVDETDIVYHEKGAQAYLVEWIEPIPGDPGTPEVLAAFTGCTRGAEGTTAASHSDGTAISQAEWVGETGGDAYGLLPGETLPVTIYLEADIGIDRGECPFTTIIIAQDSPF